MGLLKDLGGLYQMGFSFFWRVKRVLEKVSSVSDFAIAS